MGSNARASCCCAYKKHTTVYAAAVVSLIFACLGAIGVITYTAVSAVLEAEERRCDPTRASPDWVYVVPFDLLGLVIAIGASSLCIHVSRDDRATARVPPFARVFGLLMFGCSLQLTGLILGLISDCVTAMEYSYWYDYGACVGRRWVVVFVRAPPLVATLVCACLAARARGKAAARSLAQQLTTSTPSVVELSEVQSSADVNAKPSRQSRLRMRSSCALCGLTILGAAALTTLCTTTVTELALRKECACTEASWGASYTETRYCKIPSGYDDLPSPPDGAEGTSFMHFGTCGDVARYMRAGSCPGTRRYWMPSGPTLGGRGGGDSLMAETMAADDSSARSGVSAKTSYSAPSGSASPGVSGTNVQVEGVDEADFVKADESYVYTLTPTEPWSSKVSLNVVRIWPVEKMAIEATLPLSDGPYGLTPRQLMLHGDVLLVLGEAWMVAEEEAGRYSPSDPPMTVADSELPAGRRGKGSFVTTRLLMYNVSERSAPVLLKAEEVEGNYVSARKVDSHVYVVSSAITPDLSLQADHPDAGALLPLRRTLTPGGDASPTPFAPAVTCAEVGYVPDVRATSVLVVASINLAAPQAPLRATATAGRGANVYASRRSLYVASNAWGSGWWSGDESTVALRFALNDGDVAFAGLARAEGYILSQWAMDERSALSSANPAAVLSGASGVTFRLVTTTSGEWSDMTGEMQGGGNHLYTFGVGTDGLAALGDLSDLAPGERVYAVRRLMGKRLCVVRFMGERLYVVTFRQVDPLFVIDLSAPGAPVLLGELKVPGYSDYLHPVNSTHLIGVGKDASLDGRVRGLKLALFDATDPTAPTEAYHLIVGERSTESEALEDHKAFSYDAERRLLSMPLRLSVALTPAYESDQGTCSRDSWAENVWQGLVVWHVGEGGFELRGLVAHYDAATVRHRSNFETSYPSSYGDIDSPPVMPMRDRRLSDEEACDYWSLPTCSQDSSHSILRALYLGDQDLVTVSHTKVRIDSLGAMASLSAAATLSNSSALDPSGAAAWEHVLNGSLLGEVMLPHYPCGAPEAEDADGMVMEEPMMSGTRKVSSDDYYYCWRRSRSLKGIKHERREKQRALRATSSCACVCTSHCDARGAATVAAARAALGLEMG